MLLNDKKGSGGCKKACANTTFEKVYTISPICLLALSTRGCRRVLLTTNGGTKKKRYASYHILVLVRTHFSLFRKPYPGRRHFWTLEYTSNFQQIQKK